MSFSSMLQMARGREPPPSEQKLSQATNTSDNKDASSVRPAPQPKVPQSTNSKPTSVPPVKKPAVPPRPPQRPQNSEISSSSAQKKTSVQTSGNNRMPISSGSKAVSKPTLKPTQSSHVAPKSSKNALPSSVSKTTSSSRYSPAVSTTISQRQQQSPSPGSSTRKKLSFKDVMDQASKVNISKLEVNLRTKDSRKKNASETAPRKPRLKSNEPISKEGQKTPHIEQPRSPIASRIRTNGPAPVAQPLPEVLEKRQRQLEARAGPSRRRIDEEDDLGDFIASEDEDDEAPHDEIWRMFNRGPKKRYVDYDSDDDMEARGDDILHEERRSALQARREDAEEERKLAELSQRKQQQQRKRN